GERRLQTLRDLGRIEVKSADEACQIALNTLAANPYDVPFALVYLLEDDAREAHLICTSGIENDSTAAPALVTMNDDATWPLRDVFETGAATVVSDVEKRFGSL